MRAKAFTLVEVLIVVIILGILAAIVVPQFSSASEDAKLVALQSNLQTIRGQIQLYKIQHNNFVPALATFGDQMTKVSKADGTTAAIGTAGYPYGPYLQTIPNNPYTGTNDVSASAIGATLAWNYDAATGTFKANDSVAHAAN
jgi:general secretion pathway protein G